MRDASRSLIPFADPAMTVLDAPLQPPTPTPPTPPALPGTPVVDLAASALSGASPVEVLRAARAASRELRSQVDRLEDQRNDLIRELRGDNTPGEAKPGIEARLKDVEGRILSTEQQIASADQAVARAAAVPGSTEPPPPPRTGPPEEVFIIIPVMFTLFVLCPIAVAYARRLWKKGSTIIAPVPQEVRDRLDRMSEAVESIALEVERIGEGQRFVTKVMTEGGRSLGAGAAQPINVAQGEKVGVAREL